MELKAQLGQYKQLLIEMIKPLDSCRADDLPSTSSLPEGEVMAIVEVRRAAAAAKSWTHMNAAKIRLFLQSMIEIYCKAVQAGGALASCSTQWERKSNIFNKQF